MMINAAFWKGKRVLLTGHTGFKGSWLSLWLQSMGAQVHGYALAAPTQPSLFEEARVTYLVNQVEVGVELGKTLQHLLLCHRTVPHLDNSAHQKCVSR